MKKLMTIWQAMAIATLIIAVMYLCSSCTETSANSAEIDYEDEWCLAEGQGIALQEIQFINGEPTLYGESAFLTEEAENLIRCIFNNETDIWQFPIAAVCWKTSYGGYVIDLD